MFILHAIVGKMFKKYIQDIANFYENLFFEVFDIWLIDNYSKSLHMTMFKIITI